MDRPQTARRVALIGLMGAGKTRVGEALAGLLGSPFVDADRRLEEETGMTVPEIFAAHGEAGFREREAALLRRLAGSPPPFVASLGGGVVELPENRACLARDFFVVWIRVDPREAARRLRSKQDRPLLEGGDPVRILTGLAARRSPHYQRLAHLTVGTDPGSTPRGLAERIVREGQGLLRGAVDAPERL